MPLTPMDRPARLPAAPPSVTWFWNTPICRRALWLVWATAAIGRAASNRTKGFFIMGFLHRGVAPCGPFGHSCAGGNWRGIGCFRIRKKPRGVIPPGAWRSPAPRRREEPALASLWMGGLRGMRWGETRSRGVRGRDRRGAAFRAAIGPLPPARGATPPRGDTDHPTGAYVCVCVSFPAHPQRGGRHQRRLRKPDSARWRAARVPNLVRLL